MSRNRARNDIRSRRGEHRPSSRVRLPGIWLAAAVVMALGLVALFISRQRAVDLVDSPSAGVKAEPSSRVRRASAEAYTEGEINAAVNQLFAAVNPSLSENQYFTEFAKEKLSWVITEQKAGRLSLMLLKNVETTNLDVEDLMAAGRVEEGKAVIVIARPRFVRFLVEGGRTSAPFTNQQRNDFALGLVHETVHLQNPEPGNPANLQDRVAEELRAWREVNLNVVRQWRALNQPMNSRMIEADDALRPCADALP